MATDFRDERGYPRRGRIPMGRFLWLARVVDKGRAAAAGTLGEYYYPCPIDCGMLERWGVLPAEFDAALREHASDEAIFDWLRERVADAAIDAANSWLAVEKVENLDRQDREEGAFAELRA